MEMDEGKLFSKSGNAMNRVNFDILYANKIMEGFEHKSEQRKQEEKAEKLIENLNLIKNFNIKNFKSPKDSSSNISKLLESFKQTKFLQNFDTSMLERRKKFKSRVSFNIIPQSIMNIGAVSLNKQGVNMSKSMRKNKSKYQ